MTASGEKTEKLRIILREQADGSVWAVVVGRNVAKGLRVEVPGEIDVFARTRTVTEMRVEEVDDD